MTSRHLIAVFVGAVIRLRITVGTTLVKRPAMLNPGEAWMNGRVRRVVRMIDDHVSHGHCGM